MVHTKVKPILLSGECYMGNGELRHERGAIDPHHKELQANMSQDTVTSHMRHLLTTFRVFMTCRLKSGICPIMAHVRRNHVL